MIDLTHVRFQGRSTIRSRTALSRREAPRAWEPKRALHTGERVAAPAPPLPAAILERAGLEPAAYRPGPLARRVGACLRLTRAGTEAAALARLDARPELLGPALDTVLIGVSGFFRDAAVFETLAGEVVARLRARSVPPRVLSIGCSTGAELYSVAILLAEAGLLAGSRLLGVDCRRSAVASARAGVYGAAELGELDEARRARWFEPVGDGWRIAEPLRRAARWRVADATRAVEPGPWDLVLCRNLFIYLQPVVVERMLRGIVGALSPGGFLVVGKAERPAAGLGLAGVGRCVYRTHEH